MLFLWATLFGIGFGFVECSVVVYLRSIYYPEGFAFPLKPITGTIAITELLREAATLVMLLSFALMAARKASERFAWFIYLFAIWDIFYYVFLKIMLGWPESWLTWDILFLLPLPWVGPVAAPLINSFTIILLAVVIISISRRGIPAGIRPQEWLMLLAGSVITILTYTLDYIQYMLERFPIQTFVDNAGRPEVLRYSSWYTPREFNWILFIIGELLFLAAITLYLIRNIRTFARARRIRSMEELE